MSTASGWAAAVSPDRAGTLGPTPRLERPGLRLRLAEIGSDVLWMAAIIVLIPVVILGIGIPIALVLRLVLWLAQSFS